MKKGLAIYQDRGYKDLRHSLCQHLCSTGDETIIRNGLEYRRKLLEEAFEYNAENKELLREFCIRLNKTVIDLYRKAWPLYEQMVRTGITTDITLVASFKMTYPTLHPIQDAEEQEVWNALQTWRYNPGFSGPFHLMLHEDHQEKYDEDAILQLQPKDEAWDEELPKEWDQDLPLTMLFHHWHTHSYYSLYDLMYVRNIEGNIHIELDYINEK